MLWNRQNPYTSPLPIVGSELVRFTQSFNDYYRPWRGWIRIEQYHAEHGIMRVTRLKLTEIPLVREFRFPPEILESGQEIFDFLVYPRGRWRDEADWRLSVEQWV